MAAAVVPGAIAAGGSRDRRDGRHSPAGSKALPGLAAEAGCPLASSLLHLHSLRPSANALLTGICHQPPEGAGLCPVPSSRAVLAFLQMLVTCLLEAHGCAWHWALTSEAQNRTVRGHDL